MVVLDLSHDQISFSAVILQDKDRLMELLTYPEVEESIKRRVAMKAKTYGQEVAINLKDQKTEPVYKIIKA
ncbi:putative chorismate mutase [Medicago truncatula]|uniref:chorismate mutase n=1 Tax=Medicago truncatula TaxID=3880 RepID=A0A072TPN5_MEDTR|nr:chorismate mutase, putative [Medicago truncatula]RHN40682.1 putative chorismate mutase [Medicago truncatula]